MLEVEFPELLMFEIWERIGNNCANPCVILVGKGFDVGSVEDQPGSWN